MLRLRSSILLTLLMGGCFLAPARVGAQEKAMILNRVPVPDLNFKVNAGAILVPQGWKTTGGVTLDLYNQYLGSLEMRINDPQSLKQVEFFYQRPFVWADNGGMWYNGIFVPNKPGAIHVGQEVQPQVLDPKTFVQQYVLPRFRQGLQPKIIGSQLLPAVAKAAGVRGCGRVRVAYHLNGQAIEEDFYVTLDGFTTNILNQPVTFWGTKAVYAVRSAKGQLDADTGLLVAVAHSLRFDLQWYADLEQAKTIWRQIGIDASNAELVRAKIRSAAQAQISQIIRDSYASRQATLDRIHQQFSNYIRGVQQYVNPSYANPVSLPSGYRYVWGNSLGQYILSNNANVQPPNSNWQLLKPAR